MLMLADRLANGNVANLAVQLAQMTCLVLPTDPAES